MMTCVSLRSGVASRGKVTIAYHPPMQARANKDKTASLCFTEKSMTRLIIVPSLALAGKAAGVALKGLFAAGRAEVVRGALIGERVADGCRFHRIHGHAAVRILHAGCRRNRYRSGSRLPRHRNRGRCVCRCFQLT